jgi:hypothetical protein
MQVQNAPSDHLRGTRYRLLALPDQLAEAVAVETNPAEVGNLLTREFRALCWNHQTPFEPAAGSSAKVRLGGRPVRGGSI